MTPAGIGFMAEARQAMLHAELVFECVKRQTAAT